MNAPQRSIASQSIEQTRNPEHSLEQHNSEVSPLATLPLASLADLVPWSGVAAKAGSHELALFYLPGQQPELYAVSHRDPATGAAVIAHGLIGESQGEFYVASPLHKQQYRLKDGICLTDPSLALSVYPVSCRQGHIWLNSGTNQPVPLPQME